MIDSKNPEIVYPKELRGNFVRLRTLVLDDAETIFNWRSSASGKFLNQPLGYSLLSQIEWMKNRPSNEINFMICDKRMEKDVGTISIVNISPQDFTTELGRLLLDPVYLKKSNPFGLEAIKLCCQQIFDVWKFNKVYGTILSDNFDMLRFQTYLGMEEEGILKKHRMRYGLLYDIHLVALFNENYQKKYVKRLDLLLHSFL